MTAACLIVAACGDSRPAAERVATFCSAIKKGEQIEAVLARYAEFGLQPGGVPSDSANKFRGKVSGELQTTLSGVLAEPAGSALGVARPVCAVYYSERAKGGSDEVIFSEFSPEWTRRY
jgi:hypothetical protein